MKRILFNIVGFFWIFTAFGQLEIVDNAKIKFNNQNFINISRNGNVAPTSGKNFSLSPGLFIERTSGNSSGGIFISEATSVVLWAGSYSSTINLVEFGQNTGSTFRTASYINYAGQLVTSSDSILKTNISKINNISTKLQKVGAYRYHMKINISKATIKDSISTTGQVLSEKSDSFNVISKLNNIDMPLQTSNTINEDDTSNFPYCIGLMAQEVEKVFPELVEEHDGIKYVNYTGMVPILLEAINEQQTIINLQQKMLNEQGKRINDLQKEIDNIKKFLKIK